MGCPASRPFLKWNDEALREADEINIANSQKLGGFMNPRVLSDPEARDDNYDFPLNGQDISTVSDEKLASMLHTAPLLYDCGEVFIVRVSASLVLKGGERVRQGESGNMRVATERLNLCVPRVHRAFSHPIKDWAERTVEGHFLLMDYVRGTSVGVCWDSLGPNEREAVASQVAGMIEKMQSTPLEGLPAGPVGEVTGEPFGGPWFSMNGAGPFETCREIQDWCNHKIDVCIRFRQLPDDAPRFEFDGELVLTHQDVAPRNLILDPEARVWLVDWELAGAYPRGFEQAVLAEQSRNQEFSDMVLTRLSNTQDRLTKQLASIAYGLTTASSL